MLCYVPVTSPVCFAYIIDLIFKTTQSGSYDPHYKDEETRYECCAQGHRAR